MTKHRVFILFFGLALSGFLLQLGGKSLNGLPKCHVSERFAREADGEEPANEELDGCEE